MTDNAPRGFYRAPAFLKTDSWKMAQFSRYRQIRLNHPQFSVSCRHTILTPHTQTLKQARGDSELALEMLLSGVVSAEVDHWTHLKRFRGGLVFKAHRLLFYATLGLRVIKKRILEPFGSPLEPFLCFSQLASREVHFKYVSDLFRKKRFFKKTQVVVLSAI